MLRIEALPAHDRALVVAELVPLRLWWSGCLRKRCHRDIGAAIAEARRMTTEHEEPFEAYFCSLCLGYHVGHAKG